jgi:methyl-accepting chemotaxis protein
MKIENLGFVRSLLAALMLAALALVATAAITWITLDGVSGKTDDAASRLVPQLGRVSAMELAVTRTSLQLRHAMLSRTPEELKKTLDDVAVQRKSIDDELRGFLEHVKSEKGKALATQLSEQLAAFWKVGEANLLLINAGKKDDAFSHLVDTVIPVRNKLLATIDEDRKLQQELLSSLVNEADSDAQRAQWTLAAVVATVLALLGGTALMLGSYVRRRVDQATQVAAAIGAGDLSRAVPVQGRDEFLTMFRQFAATQSALADVVSRVRENAENVATASTQIAQGHLDLSGRTEKQAAALQQTAGTMEELGTTVRHNADSAHQANQLAQGASSVAAQGGEVVGKVVATMGEINDGSRRIGDIIGVIDGIAFQTNILALNAAVEAARAGEQGRGFAVVAAEVRTLAKRSADAAREIKTLIGQSMERVEHGTNLVAQAGKTMGEIVSSIQRVSDIVAEISTASGQQSSGVQQVGLTITELDRATQQNAALVEEGAAAAESLKGRSAELVQAVAVFKLSPTHGAG